MDAAAATNKRTGVNEGVATGQAVMATPDGRSGTIPDNAAYQWKLGTNLQQVAR